MRVGIVGAGGHAQVVADILLQQQKNGEPIQPIGYFDDNRELHGSQLLGLSVLGGMSLLEAEHRDFDQLVIAIGNNAVRQKLATRLAAHSIAFANAIHPTAVIGTDVELGAGVMICANAVINPASHIGNHVIINTASTVDHHSVVDDFAHLAPGTHTGGEVQIRKGAFLGIGSIVLPRQTIGAWATVGGGAVVNTNIGDDEVVVGIPARPIKR